MTQLKYESEDWQQLVVRLREIAKEKGITQEIISIRTGMKQHSISRIFSLNFTPKISTLVSIAKALKVEIMPIEIGFDVAKTKEQNLILIDRLKDSTELISEIIKYIRPKDKYHELFINKCHFVRHLNQEHTKTYQDESK